MKNFLMAIVFLAGIASVNAQEKESDSVKLGWTEFGTFSVLFNQAAFNAEWQEGGVSSYGGTVHLDYNFNYRTEDLTWDNKLIAEYGVIKTEGDEFMRKTVDRLEFYSVAGKQIKESNWFYSLFLNFKTQFAPGYEYSEKTYTDPTGEEISVFRRGEKKTHIFSPADLKLGVGFLWKKSNNLKVNISPVAARLTIVDGDFTSVPGYVDGDYFGVDAGKSTMFELGASLKGYARLKLFENVYMENILSLYSNYLEEPQNVDIDYTMNLVMKVNKFLSANFVFQAIYDDNDVEAFQIREALGIGLTYHFGETQE